MERVCMRLGLVLSTVLGIVVAGEGARASEPPRTMLFYGNSFTMGSGGVQLLVREIALAAGQPAPTVVSGANPGWSLRDHINANTQIIGTGLPAGQTWDIVVLQDFSLRPTRLGDTAAHRADVLTLSRLVRAHSPGVRVVMFETWARSPGFSYYLPPNPAFPGGPMQMQRELRQGYVMSTLDVLGDQGPASAVLAPVGDAFEAGAWANLYSGDLYHANHQGSVLAAMVLYNTIYTTCLAGLDAAALGARLGLSAGDITQLAALADSVACAGSAGPRCDPLDFNSDGLFPDTADLDDFLGVLAGGPGACSNPAQCGDLDFNNDGIFPDSADLDAFLTRMAGGPCA